MSLFFGDEGTTRGRRPLGAAGERHRLRLLAGHRRGQRPSGRGTSAAPALDQGNRAGAAAGQRHLTAGPLSLPAREEVAWVMVKPSAVPQRKYMHPQAAQK